VRSAVTKFKYTKKIFINDKNVKKTLYGVRLLDFLKIILILHSETVVTNLRQAAVLSFRTSACALPNSVAYELLM